jgi:hypothetical protein
MTVRSGRTAPITDPPAASQGGRRRPADPEARAGRAARRAVQEARFTPAT